MQRHADDVPSAPQNGSYWNKLRPNAARMRVIRGLFPFVWPVERPDLQRTVILSLALMFAAKIVTVLMPYTFKWATDGLVAISSGKPGAAGTTFWLVASVFKAGSTLITTGKP